MNPGAACPIFTTGPCKRSALEKKKKKKRLVFLVGGQSMLHVAALFSQSLSTHRSPKKTGAPFSQLRGDCPVTRSWKQYLTWSPFWGRLLGPDHTKQVGLCFRPPPNNNWLPLSFPFANRKGERTQKRISSGVEHLPATGRRDCSRPPPQSDRSMDSPAFD